MQIMHLEIVHPLGNFHAVQTGRLDPGTELDKEMELNEARGVAWRIIPVSKWLVTMVSKSPKWGYSPYKWPKWLINGGY